MDQQTYSWTFSYFQKLISGHYSFIRDSRLKLSVDGKPRSGASSAHPCLCCFKNMVSWFEIVIVNIVLNRYLFIRLCRAIFFSTSGRFRSKPICLLGCHPRSHLPNMYPKTLAKTWDLLPLKETHRRKTKQIAFSRLRFASLSYFPVHRFISLNRSSYFDLIYTKWIILQHYKNNVWHFRVNTSTKIWNMEFGSRLFQNGWF